MHSIKTEESASRGQHATHLSLSIMITCIHFWNHNTYHDEMYNLLQAIWSHAT
eukprot:m.84707 g.84707  ORF g.84707 m.84707 type:complete len:53 (+) comp12977_c0_seq1:157-315(+)